MRLAGAKIAKPWHERLATRPERETDVAREGAASETQNNAASQELAEILEVAKNDWNKWNVNHSQGPWLQMVRPIWYHNVTFLKSLEESRRHRYKMRWKHLWKTAWWSSGLRGLARWDIFEGRKFIAKLFWWISATKRCKITNEIRHAPSKRKLRCHIQFAPFWVHFYVKLLPMLKCTGVVQILAITNVFKLSYQRKFR